MRICSSEGRCEPVEVEVSMFCSACGQAMVAGQAACSRCGRPVMVAPPATPGFQFELTSYISKLRSLSVVWFIYGGFSVLLGIIGMAFADAFLSGRFHYWMHGPFPPHMWFGPAILRFAWVFLIIRAGLSLAAGWGLAERTAWGRVIAIVAAFANILKFPFGTALGIWTLVMLMGYRNATLYDRVAEG